MQSAGATLLSASWVCGARASGSRAPKCGQVDLTRVGPPHAPAPESTNLLISPAQWRADLAFMASVLTHKHPDPFRFTDRATFEKAATELSASMDRTNPDQNYVGLDHLANLIGDGHTYLSLPDDPATFPLEFRRFGNDFRVTRARKGFEKALGCRLIAIDQSPAGTAFETLHWLTPIAETPQLRDARAANFMQLGVPLHGLGLTANRDHAAFTLQTDAGQNFVQPVDALFTTADTEDFVSAGPTPLFRQHPKEVFWFDYISDHQTVYCSFRGYTGLKGNARSLFDFIKAHRTDKLIVDLRQNGGGDYKVGLRYLVRPLKRDAALNRRGHLFVLVGVNTFSAAMSNAAHFHNMTNATLAGEPIGERPNSFQEVREVRLPNSRLKLRYSIDYYSFWSGPDNEIVPDKVIPTSWDDFKTGQDPVLDWVLSY